MRPDQAPAAAPSPPGSPRLPPLLRRAWYGLNQAFRRRISHLDLTPDQYTVLRNLREAGRRGMTQTELTDRMTSDPNTIASLVDRMERLQLLVRETDAADRRARRLRIAPKGRARFAAARRVADSLQEEILGVLPGSDRPGFIEALDRVAEACREAAQRQGADPS